MTMRRLALILLALPILAASSDVPGWFAALPETVQAACKAQGGCSVTTQAWLDQMMQRAFDAGRKSCERDI